MNLTWILVGILVLVLLALVFAFPKSASSAAPLQDAFLQATQAAPTMMAPSKEPVSIGPTKVLDLQNGDEADGFLSQGPAILMVYATWCGHCKNMMPAYDQVSTQTNVKFARIEGHKAPQFMQKHGIRGFPTLLTVNRVNELNRYMGGRDVGSLLSAANELATAVVSPPAAPAESALVTPPSPAAAVDTAAPSEAPGAEPSVVEGIAPV